MYLFSFVLVSLCCVGFCSGARAEETQYSAGWTLQNHQDTSPEWAAKGVYFNSFSLNINGPLKAGQTYYCENSPQIKTSSSGSTTSFSTSIISVTANVDGFYWWVEGSNLFYYCDHDTDWIRATVLYVITVPSNNANWSWPEYFNNTWWVKIHTSNIVVPPAVNKANDILTALNNINGSVTTSDAENRKRLDTINNSINNNYNDLTRPSDSDVDSASGTLSDTSDVTAKTGLFTSIDNLTQGVFNLFTNPGSTSLTFPGFGMEVDGVSYDVWADTAYNLSDIDDKFGGLMSVVRFATSLLVYLALIRYLINTYHRIFGEGE